MSKHVLWAICLVLAILQVGPVAIASDRSSGGEVERQTRVSIHETVLRRSIKSRTSVDYPPDLLKRGIQGVVVLELLLTTEGRVAVAKVLQAPTPELGKVVAATVNNWLFSPVRAGRGQESKPAEVESKLTFYFRVMPDGRGTVVEPSADPEQSADALQVREVPQKEWSAAAKGRSHVLLDIRDRSAFKKSHSPSSLNIPGDELSIRFTEIPRSGVIAIECYPNSEPLCRMCARTLLGKGFKDVVVVLR